MPVQYIVNLRAARFVTDYFIIGSLDCFYIRILAAVGFINELFQKTRFFLIAHVAMVSRIMIPYNCFYSIM